MKTKEIFNIFSRKKLQKKEEKPLKIMIDYREKNSLVPYELSNLGVGIEFRELKVGDYLAGEVAVERKTVSDFISSMINHRLINQIESLKQYPSKLLIIEGMEEHELYNSNFDNEGKGVHSNAIRGFLLSIVLKHSIPIIFTKDSEDTAKYLFILLKKSGSEIPLNAKRKSKNKKEQLQIIIEGFPGIGPKTAKKLLGKFGTIKKIINAPEGELRQILGKKAEIFLDLINGIY